MKMSKVNRKYTYKNQTKCNTTNFLLKEYSRITLNIGDAKGSLEAVNYKHGKIPHHHE